LKDALRMTARTDNGKCEMRGFFATLRMTSKNRHKQDTEILALPE
jgi:hypothetical protein